MKKIVIGNWKMNPQTIVEAKKILKDIKKIVFPYKKTTLVIAPPYPFLGFLSKLDHPKNMSFGSQDISMYEKGSHTGEVSGSMINGLGGKYSIIGHSDKRKAGESDQDVAKKIEQAIISKITPVVCIGETERDGDGSYLETIKKQISIGLSSIPKKELTNIIIAYEPVWAIGKSYKESMHPTDVHEMTLFIKKFIGELFGKDISDSITILYGGSVEVENAPELVRLGNIDGFLVGRASLVAEQFAEIVKAVNAK